MGLELQIDQHQYLNQIPKEWQFVENVEENFFGKNSLKIIVICMADQASVESVTTETGVKRDAKLLHRQTVFKKCFKGEAL